MSKTSLRFDKPDRILLCRTDHLGDVVLALPCALLLKKVFPDSWVSFLVQPYAAPIVGILAGLDQVLEVDAKTGVRHLTEKLRGEHFGAAVALYPELRLARALQMAAIPIRSGIAYRWYSSLFSYRHREHRKLNLKHELEYNLSLTFSTFCREGDWKDYLNPESILPLDLRIPEEVVQKLAPLLSAVTKMPRRIVAIHPGGGGSAHRWPIESFCELARKLTADSDALVVITGIEEEMNICNEVSSAAGGNSLNLCAKLSLLELAEVYRHCSLLISNSTGPLHLCRAIGTSVLGLFPSDAAMSPVRWGPYGLLENVLTSPQGKSMAGTSVATVLERALTLLEEKA